MFPIEEIRFVVCQKNTYWKQASFQKVVASLDHYSGPKVKVSSESWGLEYFCHKRFFEFTDGKIEVSFFPIENSHWISIELT